MYIFSGLYYYCKRSCSNYKNKAGHDILDIVTAARVTHGFRMADTPYSVHA
jgi:hypothetical protein